jgi:hypothetical protein
MHTQNSASCHNMTSQPAFTTRTTQTMTVKLQLYRKHSSNTHMQSAPHAHTHHMTSHTRRIECNHPSTQVKARTTCAWLKQHNNSLSDSTLISMRITHQIKKECQQGIFNCYLCTRENTRKSPGPSLISCAIMITIIAKLIT